MPIEKSSRKYQLTINNPIEHGFTHEQIKKNLETIKTVYWCMCDEIGLEEQTPHTHIFLCSKNAIMFSTIQKRFYGAHIELVRGSWNLDSMIFCSFNSDLVPNTNHAVFSALS